MSSSSTYININQAASTYNPPNCIVGTGTDGVTSSAPNCSIGKFYDYDKNLGQYAFFDMIVRYDGSSAGAIYVESGSTGGWHMNLDGSQSGPNSQVAITGSTAIDTGVVSLWSSNAGPQWGEWVYRARCYAPDGGGSMWMFDYVNGLMVNKVKLAAAGHYRKGPPAGGGHDQVWYFHSDHQNFIGRLAAARRFEGQNPMGSPGNQNFVPKLPLGQTFTGSTNAVRCNGFWTFGGDQSSFVDQSDGYPGGLYLPDFTSTQQTGNGAQQSIAHGLGDTPDAVIVTVEDNNAGNFVVTQGTHTSTNVLVTVTNGVKYRVRAYKSVVYKQHTAAKGNGKASGWPVPASTYDSDCPVNKVGDIYVPNGGLSPTQATLPGAPWVFDDFVRGASTSLANTLAGLGPQDYLRRQQTGPDIGSTRSDGSLGALTWNQLMSAGASWEVPVAGRAAAIEYSIGTAGALLRTYAQQPELIYVSHASITADHTVVVERREATQAASSGLDQTGALVRMVDANNYITVYNIAGSTTLFIYDYQGGGNVNGFSVQATPTNTSWTKLLVKCLAGIVRVYVDSGAGVTLTDGNGNSIPSPSSNKWELLTWSAGGAFGGGTDYTDGTKSATGIKCGVTNAGGSGVIGHGCWNAKSVAIYKS